MRNIPIGFIVFASFVIVAGCNRGSESTGSSAAPNFAFITNGVAGFWEIAESGARAAGRDLGVQVTVIMPNGMTDQTRKIEDLLIRGTDGIAVSPIDPENQVDILNKAAAETNLITHDSDAPQTKRLAYIGMDNYVAGQICGEKFRDAMPEGGQAMILIGRMDQDNSKRRRQGCIDGFLGRDADPTRSDPPGTAVTSEDGKYTILGTITDQFDFPKAKANAEDALARHPDLDGFFWVIRVQPAADHRSVAGTR
jgi:ribose transport system substrate-binding protein